MKFNVLRNPKGELIGAYQFVVDVTDRLRDKRGSVLSSRPATNSRACWRSTALLEANATSLAVIGAKADDVAGMLF
jgi:hypothetical protein